MTREEAVKTLGDVRNVSVYLRNDAFIEAIDLAVDALTPREAIWRGGRPFCAACGLQIARVQKYCQWCGRPVLCG